MLTTRTDYPPGPAGPDGKEANDLPSAGSDGFSWPPDVLCSLQKTDVPRVAGFCSPESLLMLLHGAEIDLLSERRGRSAQRLAWIIAMCREATPTNQFAGPFTPPDLRTPALQMLPVLLSRSEALLNRIAQGSDFFGRRKGWTPLADYQYLEAGIAALTPIATKIEKEAERFWKDEKNLEEARSALTETVKLFSDAVQLLKTSLDEEQNRSNNLQDQIRSLTEKMLVMEGQIQSAEDAFMRALVNKGNGCTISQFFTFVASVVAVAVGMYAAIAGIVSSVSDYATASELGKEAAAQGTDAVPTNDAMAKVYKNVKPEERLAKWRNDKNFITVLSRVGKDLGEIGKEIGKVEAMVKERDDNRAKIAMQQEDLRQVLQPFLDMEEARHLQDLLKTFLATAQARNECVLDYTQSQLRLEDLRMQIELKTHRVADMQEYLAAHQNPEVESVSCFLSEALHEAKMQLIWWLHMAQSSLSFWSLRDIVVTYNDKTVASLLSTYVDWKRQEAEAIESSGRPEAPYGGREGIAFAITPQTHPKRLAQFIKTGEMVLNLRPNDPAFNFGLSSMRIRRFSAMLNGAKAKGNASRCIANIELQHLGSSVFETTDHKAKYFHHEPRKASFAYDVTRGNNSEPVTDGTFNGGAVVREKGATVYADVSQLGMFSLRIDPASFASLDLSGLSSVDLRFWGTFLPFKS